MIGLYAGSFDPPHHGHVDVIRRAAGLCERLLVGVAVNPDKTPFLAADERVSLLASLCRDVSNVTIETYVGATALHAQKRGVSVLVRALRTAVDAEFERQLATVNRQVAHLETILLLADAPTAHLSSSLTRDAARAGLPLDSLCPPAVAVAALAAARAGR